MIIGLGTAFAAQAQSGPIAQSGVPPDYRPPVQSPAPAGYPAVPPDYQPQSNQPAAQAPLPGSYPAVPPDYRAPAPGTAPGAYPVAAPADSVPVQYPAPPVAGTRPMCHECGIVESMREVTHKGQGTGLGAVAGGIGGLILGHQLGNGTGNRVATVLGAAGGALAGNEIEKRVNTSKSYEIGVRMEDGGYRTITTTGAPPWRAGDHVRVVNGALTSDPR